MKTFKLPSTASINDTFTIEGDEEGLVIVKNNSYCIGEKEFDAINKETEKFHHENGIEVLPIIKSIRKKYNK
jgi:hypothetical protein